eukprot:CAMPEP_0206195426 /NCGR_PEP_ID=MMETSP0166-20121206/7827_1 /ASSEMBLY_ACC=CAM_ASM_000260 /TAXON_ID=95228 /ORGANISM="Vannella robusta, Strain DIVA3 518/3/11/1/6" /LENGTH=296 /DNA_ID=CAMNT_0053612671 /DNA_START=563 /DNA_END=1450 /DNA_ORIENTATION=+
MASKHAQDILQVVQEDSYHLECYYDKLKDWTFKSVWFDLPVAKAKVLGEARARKVRCQPEDLLLNELALEIDDQITKVGGKAVVRLSTRSPKDIVLQRPPMFDYFEQEENTLKNDGLREDVRQMIAMTRAAGRAMAVSSGREAVDMFIDSQRIFDDVNTACSVEPPHILRVLVREFVPLRSELELRVFVNDGKVSAISQYYASCQVKWLHENKERVQNEIFNAVEKVLPLLGLAEFVIDFAYDTNEKLWVVEVNLPPPLAGMSMFDKKNPEDVAIVSGQRDFEFRLAPLDAVEDCR